MSALRLGVIGCGAVTERYHLPALLASADVRVVAFADPALERARTLADKVKGAVAVADPAGIAGRVDAVLVAAPNAVHERIATPLLAAGVHVLVEKPMARTTAECDRMIAAAAAGPAVLAVGHDFRHFPVARFARQLFASGMAGTLRRVDVRQSAGGRWPYASPAALSREAGGGVLLDFGVHLLDLLLWWLGDLRPQSFQDDAEGGIETECLAELATSAGLPVRLELSRSRTLRDTIVVEGNLATVELGVFEPVVVRVTPAGGDVASVGGVPDIEFERAPLATVFGRQLAEFVRAVRGAGAPTVTGEEGRRGVALAEACYAMRRPLRMPWDYPEAYAAVGREAP